MPSDTRAEFEEWLAHYREVTGYTQVRGSKAARREFNGRRREGIPLDELKLATVGCHADTFCRSHHFDVPETILRASKVTRYIMLARDGNGNGALKSAEERQALVRPE